MVVVSSAIKRANPELVAAREKHLPVVRRAEMLAELMRFRDAIAIGGTHGKTTSSSMLMLILAESNAANSGAQRERMLGVDLSAGTDGVIDAHSWPEVARRYIDFVANDPEKRKYGTMDVIRRVGDRMSQCSYKSLSTEERTAILSFLWPADARRLGRQLEGGEGAARRGRAERDAARAAAACVVLPAALPLVDPWGAPRAADTRHHRPPGAQRQADL